VFGRCCCEDSHRAQIGISAIQQLVEGPIGTATQSNTRYLLALRCGPQMNPSP